MLVVSLLTRGNEMNCPNGHGKMVMNKVKEKITFRGHTLIVPVEQYVCPKCGIKAGTVKQTAEVQKAMADAYRKSVGLLTGTEIIEKRKKLNFTQEN
jgi:C4-type Zn-finger protein